MKRISPIRRGYTMIEMMAVIAIITLLMSISFGILRNAITLARQRQTEATILKVHGLMQQRIDAFNRAVDRLNLTPNKKNIRLFFNTNYGGAAGAYVYDNSPILNVLARKQLFQSRFPQNFSERDLSSTTGYVSGNHQRVTESSAMLYWILTSSDVFGISPVDEQEFSSNEVRDTDGDGLMEFVDGWGKPLRFYRWPTLLFRPTGATGGIDRSYVSLLWSGLPAHPPEDINGNGVLDSGEDLNGNGTLENYDIDPLVRDPDDPTAQMYQLTQLDTSGGTIATAFENLFNTPSTYHAFLIVSPGPDGILGLGEPFDYAGTSDPTQTVPTVTATWPALTIPVLSPSPALTTMQGRLAALDQNYAATSITSHPINDNITNRKR